MRAWGAIIMGVVWAISPVGGIAQNALPIPEEDYIDATDQADAPVDEPAGWLGVVNAPAAHDVGPEFSWEGPVWLRSTLNAPSNGWSADIDMLILMRTDAGDLTLLRDDTTDGELVNADQMSFSGEIGPRFQLRGPIGRGWRLELGILGVDGWRSQAFVPGPVELRIPGPDDGADFVRSTSPLLDMRSQLCSQELNLRRDLNRRVSVLCGFRALQLEEWYSVSTFSTRVYEVSADNRLYGAQIGADARLATWRRFELAGFARAGLYNNDAVSETADPSGIFAATPQNRLLTANSQQAAFVGEAGLIASMRLWGFLSLRGGYQVLHLESVALATEQLPLNDFATLADPLAAQSGIDADGHVFYHGAVAGLEVRW